MKKRLIFQINFLFRFSSNSTFSSLYEPLWHPIVSSLFFVCFKEKISSINPSLPSYNKRIQVASAYMQSFCFIHLISPLNKKTAYFIGFENTTKTCRLFTQLDIYNLWKKQEVLHLSVVFFMFPQLITRHPLCSYQ